MTSGREAAAQADPGTSGGDTPRARFQPIVDLRSGRPIGWDARSPTDTDDADDGGLALLSALAAGDAPPDDGLVFVHVRADVLSDPRLVEQCERLESRVVVDVRGHEVDRLRELSSELDRLATAGVHLSIEDTSAVSLAMLARVRPAFITLDAPLVRSIDQESTSRSVVRAYVAFAEQEGIHLIAEGVERHGQVDELRNLGVILARGPLFGQPAAGWAPPRTRPRRPPLVLDPLREAHQALDGAADLDTVSHELAGLLARLGDQAAVYVERDGVLRCLASEGRTDVRDGIPVRSGPLGEAFRSARPVHWPDDRDGHRLALPIPGRRNRPLGVATVVSADGLTPEQEDHAVELVAIVSERMAALGAGRTPTATRQLAQASLELSTMAEVQEVEVSAARLACVVGDLSSAMFALPGTTGLDIKSLQGPLSPELRQLSSTTLGRLLDHIGDAASCLAFAGHDAGPGFRSLLEAGASSLIALPVRASERGIGLLVLADHAPVQLDLDRREGLELLARELARTLDMVMLVDDLRTRATVDTLTGLGNLAAFQESLEVLGARRRGGWALVMADVDGLKAINDTHGHLTGDLALRSLAGALDDVLRSQDRMFRIGGDEFAALLQDVDAEGAAEIGRRMCEAASRVMADFGAGLSVGIAIPEHGETPVDFIDRADKMLYEVKREARGTVRVAPSPAGEAGGSTEADLVLEPAPVDDR